MSTIPRSTVLAFALILVSGCVPIPNYRYYAPAVSGVVLKDGSPVEGAEVFVSGQFTEKTQSVRTAANGRFMAEPIRELFLTASLIGDPLYEYSVQVVVKGKKYDAYSEAYVGYAPREVELVCDLSKPVKRGANEVYCRSSAEWK